MTNTHTLSRRIVAAIDPDGTRWPKWRGPLCPACSGREILRTTNDRDSPSRWCHECHWHGDICECVEGFVGVYDECKDMDSWFDDFADPEALHALLEVARSLGSAYELECCPREEFVPQERTSFKFKHPLWGDRHYGETESLAVLAAVCAALGIDTTQETTHAAD